MSAELSDSLGKQSAMDILADIDSACDKLAGGNSAMIKGPFGVFQSIEEPSPADVLTSSPDTENSNTNTYPDTDSFIEEVQRHDWPTHIGDDLDLFTGPLDPSLSLNPEERTGSDQVLLPDSTMTNFFLDNSMGVEGLALFSPNFISQAMEIEAAGHGDSHADDLADSTFNQLGNEVTPCPRGLPQANGGHLGLPEEAEPLLRYYKKHVAGERTSMQAKRKSPWEIIFLPCALETFAELSLWNEASHTRSTIFYTLLAHSALQLHLSNKPSTFSCDWKEIGIRNHERAQHHLRNALQLEMFGSKQANYKELLMAILGMAMTSVCLFPPLYYQVR